MRVTIFAYSKNGCETALKISSLFPDSVIYTVNRLCKQGFFAIEQAGNELYRRAFEQSSALIFVGSCGIAVRLIAPFVTDKRSDPAVICVDERADFVIPLLSGHIGGANELAKRIANHLGAVSVITTATDINHRFSPDSWAAKNGFVISDIKAAKAVSAAILERDIPIFCENDISGKLPSGVFSGESGDVGIYIGYREREPFDTTLRLIPKVLHLGIGCRRATSAEAIESAVDAVFCEYSLDRRAVKQVCSIDLKADEEGLLSFCEKNGWQKVFYSAEQLKGVSGEFSSSKFVAQVTGTDNVCERAAMIGAKRLTVTKQVINKVTVAVAEEGKVICFE